MRSYVFYTCFDKTFLKNVKYKMQKSKMQKLPLGFMAVTDERKDRSQAFGVEFLYFCNLLLFRFLSAFCNLQHTPTCLPSSVIPFLIAFENCINSV